MLVKVVVGNLGGVEDMDQIRQRIWKRKIGSSSTTRRESFRALELSLKYLDARRVSGDICEFGTLFGDIPLHADYLFSRKHSGAQRRPISIFDSFAGLPGDILQSENTAFKEGDLANSLENYLRRFKKYGIGKGVEVFPGWFHETLANCQPERRIALAWIDADLYSSTKTVLSFLKCSLVDQALVIIDDYWATKPSRGGPSFALEEWTRNAVDFTLLPWRSFHWAGEIFVFNKSET